MFDVLERAELVVSAALDGKPAKLKRLGVAFGSLGSCIDRTRTVAVAKSVESLMEKVFRCEMFVPSCRATRPRKTLWRCWR